MNPSQILESAKAKMQAAVMHFTEELKKVRTGRAHPSMVDGVMVEAYGTNMPLIQVATVTTPEAQLIQISPFDPGNLQAISTAIRDNQALGLNPMDDGRVVRIQIPPLNEERRKELAKSLSGKVEDCMISLRNVRHDALKEAEEAKKNKDITEDDVTSVKKNLDALMTEQKNQVDIAAQTKEREIMTV